MTKKCACPFFQNGLCQAYPDGAIEPTIVEKGRYCLSGKFLHCYILGGLNYSTQAESPISSRFTEVKSELENIPVLP